ncbi:Agamous-like MADS-box protein AGL36 [Linum perenne]
MRKRRKNLIKKAQELSILCGVQVLCIVYSLEEPGVKVWPSDGPEAQEVLARYMTMPETEQSKHMIEQENFIKKMIKKPRTRIEDKWCPKEKSERARVGLAYGHGSKWKRISWNGHVRSIYLSLLLKERRGELRKKAKSFEINTCNASAINVVIGEE